MVLFHSVLGLRPAVHDFAEALRGGGHEVHVPDLYAGAAFDDMDEALRYYEGIGVPEMIARTEASVAGLPKELVYAGFSNGGVSAEYLAASRPGARGAVLMHAAIPLPRIGLAEWPRGLPVQVHYAEDDPWRTPDGVDTLAASVRAADAPFEFFEYPVSGHLFADGGLPEYHPESARSMTARILGFLEEAGSPS
ncbi:Dienelactone hydrolase [Actinomadura verrucosospora]|uniref:Dienelactone hydrolase n=1 Tax=Actinomadura verrucosospora TaxID=46165 RepID=A0A7D3ZVF4_ACTVE|nr:Dienelactone hydrolase [Actinomadura verrucosospora]